MSEEGQPQQDGICSEALFVLSLVNKVAAWSGLRCGHLMPVDRDLCERDSLLVSAGVVTGVLMGAG